jgi:hypothetical protein
MNSESASRLKSIAVAAPGVQPTFRSGEIPPSPSYDFNAMLPSVLETAAGLVPADAFAVWLLDSSHHEWRIAAGVDLSENYRSSVLPGQPEE